MPAKLGPTPLCGIPAETFEGLRLKFLPQPLSRFDLTAVHVMLPRGSSVPPIYHKVTDELVYVLEGRAWAYLGRGKFLLRPGDWLPIPAGVGHQFVPIGRRVRALSLFSPAMDRKAPDVHPVARSRK